MLLKGRIILMMGLGAVAGLAASAGGYLLKDKIRHAGFAADPLSEDQISLLGEVFERLREEYVYELDDSVLIEKAIGGMLEDLDNHSRFLSAEDYEGIRISATGQYTGVGLDISLQDGQVRVIAPLDDTPAHRAGILSGDIVMSVNDVPVDIENTDETVNRMRGQSGTSVTLELKRKGLDEPLRFALTRTDIQVKTVRTEYLGRGYGYIRLTGFADNTGKELEEAFSDLSDGNELRGVVLDLRNNPGGVLDAAVEVADAFLEQGLIVRGGGRVTGSSFEEYATSGDIFSGIEVAVLVNKGSASASEIVAAALRDHHRARLVGEQTYGKGSVQTVIPLSNGRALKLTTSHYFTPSGGSINDTGIKPDVIVAAQDPKQQYRGPGSDISPIDDIQLQEALRIIGFDHIENINIH
jgi:carboxyl-terminal processing protease